LSRKKRRNWHKEFANDPKDKKKKANKRKMKTNGQDAKHSFSIMRQRLAFYSQ